MPAGTYKIGRTLTLRGGTRLLGASRVTTLLADMLADMVDDLMQVSGFKATVSSLGFRSNRSDRTGAYIKSWASSTLLGSYLRIEGCHFDGGFNVIVGDYVQDLCIVDCNLMGFGNCGIVLGLTAHLENTYVSRCEIVSDQATAAAGIYVKDSGGLFVSQVDIYGSGKLRDAINLDAAPDREPIKWTFLDQVQCDSCRNTMLTRT
jgi:hypothetical protein